MSGRERLESYLRENGVSFEVEEHRAAYTPQKIATNEHVPGRLFAKALMATTNGALVMLVLPAPSVVDVDKVAGVVGEDVRLASESEFATTFADCEPGAMPPFGNLYDLPVYVDLPPGGKRG